MNESDVRHFLYTPVKVICICEKGWKSIRKTYSCFPINVGNEDTTLMKTKGYSEYIIYYKLQVYNMTNIKKIWA